MKKFTLILSLFIGLHLSGKAQQTLVLQPGPSDTMDVIFRSDQPDINNPTCHEAGVAGWTFNGIFGADRTYIRFDLSGIPIGAIVYTARLSLYYNDLYALYPYGHYGDNGWLIRRVTGPWNGNTLVWNTQPNATEVKEISVPPSSDPHQDYPDLDVTGLVKDMVARPDSNFGFMFRLQTEDLWRAVLLCSNDYPIPDHRPKLVVVYSTCPPPVAGYRSRVQNLTASFTDTTNVATSWFWNFGDGCHSSQQNPTHTYAQNGDFKVCLIATDSCGSDSACHTIHLNCIPPQSLFYYEEENTYYHFHDTSSTGTLISRTWNFGDDSTSTEKDPFHQFTTDSLSYTTCLTVTDSCGTSIHCEIIYRELPQVHFTAHNNATGENLIQFTGDIAGASLWQWDFGDDQTSLLKNPLHQYASTGNYHVCLTAGNRLGTKTFCDDVEVIPRILHDGHHPVILFPNPSGGIFHAEVSEDLPSASITATSVAGLTVFHGFYGAIKKTQPIPIDLLDAAPGIYYILFTCDKFTTLFKVVVVKC